MKFERIDVCAVAAGANSFPLYKAVFDWYRFLLPNFPKSCPVAVGRYFQSNVTILFDKTTQGEATGLDLVMAAITPIPFPNGVYRNTMIFYNYGLGYIGEIVWDVEVYDAMNEDQF